MLLKKIKAEGLAHLSYLVGSDGKAAVIDPRRDCGIYLDIADEENLRITHILETHRNEDYVTGSRELASLTGAEVLHGPMDIGYGRTVNDGEAVDLGQATLRALWTPGHTPESTSYVLHDRSAGGQAVGVFTGDTLFVGEVGRTDLLGKERTAELASNLYDSLHRRLLPLGDEVIIYPAHGAGSHCGGSISDREESTIGLEVANNSALRFGTREEFVAMKLGEELERPYYFRRMEDINLVGAPLLGHLPRPAALSSGEFAAAAKGAIMLDVRPPAAFSGGHVPQSISIPLEVLPNYVGWMLDYGRPVLLITDGQEASDAAVRTLVRTGYDDIAGRLGDGVEGWAKTGHNVGAFPSVAPRELHDRISGGEDLFVLDVRTSKEWKEGRVEGSTHIFVGHLAACMDRVPRGRTVAVLCSSGVRGSIGASILHNAGYDVLNVLGGTTGWKRSGLPLFR
ncbi:MAG: MBL fold metallo-hydrolase [Methanomassiliicoccus sp.]|nr:MBL fold metallo-hydrolase [Methanomassiliicoccus sp.]